MQNSDNNPVRQLHIEARFSVSCHGVGLALPPPSRPCSDEGGMVVDVEHGLWNGRTGFRNGHDPGACGLAIVWARLVPFADGVLALAATD